jgi:HAD superfamily hydrolase (TIGR01484 family)
VTADDRRPASTPRKDGDAIGSRPPALIASDLDGTLLHSDGTMSRRTVAAVRAVQDAGIHWVVATARPPRWMHDLVDVVGDHGVAICSNGAFVYDVVGQRVRSERTLTMEVLSALVDDLRAAVPDISFAVEHRDGFGREPSYEDAYREPDILSVVTGTALFEPPPGKLLARSRSTSPDEFLRIVEDVVGENAVVAFSGASGLAEISAAGVTKAAVLAEYCDDLSITADQVLAFGDMPNDVPMLTWAGTSFAVANAHPDAQAAADHTCGANDEDGVAAVLEALLQTGT